MRGEDKELLRDIRRSALALLATTAIGAGFIYYASPDRTKPEPGRVVELMDIEIKENPWNWFWNNLDDPEILQQVWEKREEALRKKDRYKNAKLLAALGYLGDTSVLPDLVEAAKEEVQTHWTPGAYYDYSKKEDPQIKELTQLRVGPSRVGALASYETYESTKALVSLLYDVDVFDNPNMDAFIMELLLDTYKAKPELRALIESGLSSVMLTDFGRRAACFIRADVADSIIKDGPESLRNYVIQNKNNFTCRYHSLGPESCPVIKHSIERAEEYMKHQ